MRERLLSGGVIVGSVPVHCLLEGPVQGGELELGQVPPEGDQLMAYRHLRQYIVSVFEIIKKHLKFNQKEEFNNHLPFSVTYRTHSQDFTGLEFLIKFLSTRVYTSCYCVYTYCVRLYVQLYTASTKVLY